MKEYFEINYKYSTAKRYKEFFSNIKEVLGNYKLSVLTPYILNQTSSTKETLRNGNKIKDISKLLGHSRIKTTENYYISSTMETRKKANIILENIIQSDVTNKIINFV